MKKKILIPILMLLLTVLYVWAVVPLVELRSPADDYYWLEGGTIDNNVTFVVNSTAYGTNTTDNCSLWTNVTGTWANAYTNTSNGSVAAERTEYRFIPGDINLGVSDDMVFVWNALCIDSGSNQAWASANRTVHVDQPPAITLTSPATTSYSSTTDVNIQYNVTGDSDDYNCYFWTNDTGTWAQDGSFSIVSNNSGETIQRQVNEGQSISWNVQCFENGAKYPNVYDFNSTNRTINVDLTVPVLNDLTPADGRGANSIPTTITVNVTDINIDTCVLNVNGTVNRTYTTITSNADTAMGFNASDGVWGWNVVCNDSAGNSVASANRSLEIDTVQDSISANRNYSVDGNCNGFQVEFIFSDEVNATFKYGTSTMAQTYTEVESDYATNQTFILTFNDSYETTFYANITFCDLAGNCNNSIVEKQIESPVSLCTGWSLWSNWDSGINLSDLYSESTADYIYKWNDSDQRWAYYSSGATAEATTTVDEGEVVFYYESGNRTYFRDTTVANYTRNIRNGYNWFGLNYQPTMGELSYNQFRNSSGGNRTNQDKQFQFNYFSAYNNSNQNYITHIYKWSLENTTTVGQNWLDTVHVFSNFTVTVDMNTTAGYGHVTGNWS